MQVRCVLLVVAATLLASCDPAVATDETENMTKISSEIESNAAILNDKRLLRSHKAGGDGAYVKNEERAINFKKLTNFKNWFRKNHCAPNHAAYANNLLQQTQSRNDAEEAKI
ncbi:unnamed protein product [Phytophthora lilii]|uniref:RxLR effector protein n=1 Tax=Phytophthora lilii TaxID=2077276 RepID=A0A9W6WPB9_9STRA|nr:unnamed protein product [Phytophthora lilii]